MKRPRPGPLDPTRIRRMQGGFGWIPHEFIRRRMTRTLSGPDLLLYFFLCAVSDARGVRFYGEALLEEHLSLDPHALDGARRGLTDKGLILYRACSAKRYAGSRSREGVYQVLPLPALPATDPAQPGRPREIRQIVHGILEKIAPCASPSVAATALVLCVALRRAEEDGSLRGR